MRLALLLWLAGATIGLRAQQYAFTQVTPSDGLAQSQVRAMAQDGQGYLWFGTLGGASRFDGLRFVNHALQDGIPDAQVSAMAVDAAGTLWMGAGSAIVHRSGPGWVTEPLPPACNGARIMSMVHGPNGHLYVGTDGGGVFVREGSSIQALKGFPVDTASNVRTLLALRDGRLLVGLRNGLLLWDKGRCTPITVGDEAVKAISALAEAPDGGWWVGTFLDGLFHIAPSGEQTLYDEESGLLRNNVRCLLVDDRGRLWIGGKFGVNLLDGGRMRVFTVHQGMPSDNIYCAFQDREGNIWFGTDGAGALKYLGDRFVTYTVKDGLCSDLVMTVVTDANGSLWLGTYDNGICRMDGMAMVTTRDGLPNNTIWCGIKDRNDALWFGTNDGLVRLEHGLVTPLPSAIAMSDLRVLSLLEDDAGNIWCGTREGLAVVRSDGSVQHHPSGSDGPGRSVRSLVRDERGGLWFASDNGVGVFDGNVFTRYTVADGLCDSTVQCLLRDGSGRLWIGTGNGLSCRVNGTFRTFRFATDFGSNFIGLLQGDSYGRIWAGTNNGLFLFHPDSLLADPAAREHITLSAGLRNLEFNLNAGAMDAQGRLFFGSAGGLVFHDSERFKDRPSPPVPQVHITGVRSFLQNTDWSRSSDSLSAKGLPIGLVLEYRRNYLTFDYTGISLSDPERVRYRYRLEGSDLDWLPATDARFASYSNLPHGDYRFEVMAAVGDGPWSAPDSFTFRIDPPFWLRWWFFVATGLLMAGSVFGVLRYRSIIRQRHERTRQLMLRSRMLQLEQQALNANMNRHFVFNALNSIQYHINKQDRATASRYLTSFAKLIRKNLDASQNDTTTLAEELERLELYLLLEHMRFKEKFRYEIVVEPNVNSSDVKLPAMMLQPYVENSIWHGILPMDKQGLVTIRVAPAGPDRVLVRIDDDGIGIDRSLREKESSDHISRGIEITKGRADVLRRLELTDIRIQGPEQWNDPETGAVIGTRVAIELPATSSTPQG
ncbi:MAG: histidine kinase [Flavobacteriales bacterium]|nr:histidine kinase [Flavobacteriales bacterium]